jgi:hypothetical protein
VHFAFCIFAFPSDKPEANLDRLRLRLAIFQLTWKISVFVHKMSQITELCADDPFALPIELWPWSISSALVPGQDQAQAVDLESLLDGDHVRFHDTKGQHPQPQHQHQHQHQQSLPGPGLTTMIASPSSSLIDHRCPCHGRSFATASSLRRHLQPPAKQHQCPHDGCGKAFRTKQHLADHERTHGSERPFVCSHAGCLKSFRQSAHLAVHMQSHMRKRSFEQSSSSSTSASASHDFDFDSDSIAMARSPS